MNFRFVYGIGGSQMLLFCEHWVHVNPTQGHKSSPMRFAHGRAMVDCWSKLCPISQFVFTQFAIYIFRCHLLKSYAVQIAYLNSQPHLNTRLFPQIFTP